METNTNAGRMSAPKFTVSRVLVLGLPRYEVSKNGVPLAHVDDPDLARVIESHAEMEWALRMMLESHDRTCPGELCGIVGVDLARAALAKARGEG